MSEPKTYYITTPIYYVNGKPHIGSALSTLCCDVLARYHGLLGRKTWFLTGTDEQATKVHEAAVAAGIPVEEFVDGLAAEFKQTWTSLDIHPDDFIRTTEPRHTLAVQEFFRRLQATGDVYKGLYEGWYCVSDETFFRDSDVGENPKCPNAECGKPLQRVQEENYFFRLSAYSDRLLAHIEANPGFLQPEFRRNEVISFIKQGLRDMSITRANTGWGIPVPDDPTRVIYVWFDALINYIAAAGWPNDPDQFAELWPADVHLMGKEIFVRFHATLWPAMLMALGLAVPTTVYSHGWWVDAEGKKEGKRTGGLPHPTEFAAEIARVSGCNQAIGVDALRYLLLREMVFPGDSEFDTDSFLRRYNSDLANDLGNLCNRSANMAARYCDSRVPQPVEADPIVTAMCADSVTAFHDAIREFRFNAALEAVWRLIGSMNRYIEEKAPWKLAKQGETRAVDDAIYHCLEATRIAGTLLLPVMPTAARCVLAQVGLGDEGAAPSFVTDLNWGGLEVGSVLPPPEPVFPRIDLAAVQTAPAQKEKKLVTDEPAESSIQVQEPERPEYIGIEDFLKVQLRVGNVTAAEKHPNADKLLKLTVELGDETRTVLAGIAEMYQPDELVGRQVVVVANLAPRKMRGIESQGMLLAADVEGQAILLRPETQVPSGARVR